MAQLGTPRRALMLSMGLVLYVILISLLMFYMEECSIETQTGSDVVVKRNEEIKNHCYSIYESFQGKDIKMEGKGTQANASIEGCLLIVGKLLKSNYKVEGANCRFNTKNFFPWVHCITFSLLTIGGSRMPVTVGGQLLLTFSTIFGIFPVVKLFIHVGIIVSSALERILLAFELQILNRSPRMIHSIFKKLLVFNTLLLISYNVILAWITSRSFYGTKWTFSESIVFWIQGLLTNGQPIDTEVSIYLYHDGGWRIMSIVLGMLGNMILSSSFACILVSKMHKKVCEASKTIKESFKRQNPEVYLQIKPLKTHL